jgi:hypothetical protein
MSETIAAIYKTQAQVRARCRTLDRVSASSIDRHMQGGSYLGESSSLQTRPVESKGFWASLFGGETYDDTRVYDENLTSGRSVVTVRAVSDAITIGSRRYLTATIPSMSMIVWVAVASPRP